MKSWAFLNSIALVALCASCSSSDGGEAPPAGCSPGTTSVCACSDGSQGMQACLPDGTGYGACACGGAVPTTVPTTGQPTPSPTGPVSGTGGASPTPTPTVTGPMPTSTAPVPTTDPVEPPPTSGGVEISGVACGGVLDANVMTPYATIGGRQVFVDYPCGKPSGTAVTFILNLHGTFGTESGKHYIRGYFPAYEYMDTHDFIIATPKSVVSQWGNGDGGQDEPHLMAVVDWMYSTFAGFDIQQMWVVGHSWGAMYTRTFACKPEFSDRVHGVVLMSGGAAAPACADRLAILGTVGETDIVAGEVSQAAAAGAHGCSPQTIFNLGNNRITEWPSCSAGWVHKNYFMLGKGHGFDPVDWPDSDMDLDMMDAIASTR